MSWLVSWCSDSKLRKWISRLSYTARRSLGLLTAGRRLISSRKCVYCTSLVSLNLSMSNDLAFW